MAKYVSKEPEITISGKSVKTMSEKENVRKVQVEIGVGVIF